MSNIRRSMMAASRGGSPIPKEYIELEYITIESATHYLITDFVPTAMCSVDITFKGTSATSTKTGYLFGCRNGWNNQSFYMRSQVSSGAATNMTVAMGYGVERTITVDINASDKNIYRKYPKLLHASV